MANAQAVGIDLGTTNSVAAYVDSSGQTVIIRNAEGDLLTPSVVLFDDREVVVGREAQRANMIHPEQVAEWVKRDMGAPVYSRPIRGRYLPPEVIQACILRRLKADVTGTLGPNVKVVITVPAYFDEARRKATADAGEMAGLSVLDIVNEPTAAAMSFGEIQGYLSPTGEKGTGPICAEHPSGRSGKLDLSPFPAPAPEMTVLVYDLGGGTFDVTLLRLAPGDVRALATDGDVQLGGYDWDLRLVNHLAELFAKANGTDPRRDSAGFYRLYNAALEAKHGISARSHAKVHVDYAGGSLDVDVTRQLFEDLTADLLERTSYTTRQLLAASGLQWSDVSRLLLVGGATRMPMVSRMLVEMTGIQPDHSVNPDEAVARGAALYASYLLARQSAAGPGYRVTNINAHSLGVEGIDAETYRKKNVVLIPRNTQLPARFTEKFTTKADNQRSIVVQVLEGESTVPGDCTAIGRTAIHNLPPGLPKGWPIEVTFEYGDNGRLSVHAVVPGTQREVALEIERERGLSSDGVSRWQSAVEGSGGFDVYEALVEEALGAAQPKLSATPTAPSPAQPGTPTGDPAHPAGDPSAAANHAIYSVPSPAMPAADERWDSGFSAAGTGGLSPDQGPAATSGPDERGPYEPLGVPQIDDVPRSGRRVPHWLITVVGFVLSSIIGLALGYLLVNKLFPNNGLPRLW